MKNRYEWGALRAELEEEGLTPCEIEQEIDKLEEAMDIEWENPFLTVQCINCGRVELLGRIHAHQCKGDN